MPQASLDFGETYRGQPEIILALPDELPAILAEHPAGELGLFGDVAAVAGDEPSVRAQSEPGQLEQFPGPLIVQVMQHARGEHEMKRSTLRFDAGEAPLLRAVGRVLAARALRKTSPSLHSVLSA